MNLPNELNSKEENNSSPTSEGVHTFLYCSDQSAGLFIKGGEVVKYLTCHSFKFYANYPLYMQKYQEMGNEWGIGMNGDQLE